jgi:sterol desaturase/sphingolipid hydroxylase (fatty acid hydroxylase superfamily)
MDFGRLQMHHRPPSVLHKNTSTTASATTSTTIDTTRPVYAQIDMLGANYDVWVHQPSAQKVFRMFENSILEAGSKNPWWMVLAVWPWVAATAIGSSLKHAAPWSGAAGWIGCAGLHDGISPMTAGLLAVVGVGVWTLLEYVLHRAVFHYPTAELSSGWIKLHFLLHGQHHKFPLDARRLVFPLVPAVAIALIFYIGLFRVLLPFAEARALFGGSLIGYVMYDMVHYYTHHGSPRSGVLGQIRKVHMDHHFRDTSHGYGISNPLWDYVFKTAKSIPDWR